MDLNSILKNAKDVKLKKVEVHDSSAPKLTGFIEEADVKAYQSTVLDSNLEYWINLLGETTFYSEFYPITPEDAQTFIESFQLWEKKIAFPAELQARIDKIEAGLQQVIEKVKGKDGTGVFVKTSSRSAKDSAVFASKFKDLYRGYLSKKTERDENDKIICLLEAGVQVLKMENAAQVLRMFSISERIMQDMKLALDHTDRFRENFIVRKWVDIDPDMEFRGFSTNNKLNALSQYNHLAYFPNLVDQKDEIQKLILDFYNTTIVPKLQAAFQAYVIDFALTKSADPKKKWDIWVIELNPFLPTTDGALFSWERERNILENGPFEFRLRPHKAKGARTMLSLEWRTVLDEVTL